LFTVNIHTQKDNTLQDNNNNDNASSTANTNSNEPLIASDIAVTDMYVPFNNGNDEKQNSTPTTPSELVSASSESSSTLPSLNQAEMDIYLLPKYRLVGLLALCVILICKILMFWFNNYLDVSGTIVENGAEGAPLVDYQMSFTLVHVYLAPQQFYNIPATGSCTDSYLDLFGWWMWWPSYQDTIKLAQYAGVSTLIIGLLSMIITILLLLSIITIRIYNHSYPRYRIFNYFIKLIPFQFKLQFIGSMMACMIVPGQLKL